jgi:phosphohistidine phosphatase
VARLLLLRHAKAEPVERGTPDFGRPLIARGEHDSKLIGRYIALNKLNPDWVLCSPSLRTRETLRLVLGEAGAKPDVVLPAALYNASADVVSDLIREHGGPAATLLVVGHNPGIEQALAALVGSTANSVPLPPNFPTASLAVITVETDDWSTLAERSGRLKAFVRPKDLGGGSAQ